MSFFGGRPGKSFTFDRIFTSTAEMLTEASKKINEEGFLLYPNSFVLIANELDENNGKVYIKRENENGYTYSFLTNIAGIIPEIHNGYWYIGDENLEEKAVSTNIEFRVITDINTSTYALLIMEVEEDTKYGLSNLTERYSFNNEVGEFTQTTDGEYIKVYKSDQTGQFYFNSITGEKEFFDNSENGMFLQSDFQGAYIGEEYQYLNADFLQWKYVDEDDSAWRNLLDVSQLNNISTFANIAARAASQAQAANSDIQKAAVAVEEAKENVLEAQEETLLNVSVIQSNVDEVNKVLAEINTKINEDIVLDTEAELVNARESFQTLKSRLDHVPYEFDLYHEMIGCQYLSAGDRCLVFGYDNVGDTDSKLYGIFSPDDERLQEVIEGSITEENPEGEKVITEQTKLNNSSLIAGLLTVFSGKGSGGGGGTTLLPTIKIDTNNLIVQSGKTATLGYTISNPVGGNITLYVKDSKGESIIDANTKKDYTKGVVIPGNASPNGTIVWKPKGNGIHTLTFYFIVARDSSFSNEELATITVGGIVLTGPLDGQLFDANKAINLKYSFTSIFTDINDAILLEYQIFKGNEQIGSGTLEKVANSVGDFTINVKALNQNIGYGGFKVIATAYLKSDKQISSSTVITNFSISQPNTIILLNAYNGEDEIFAEMAYSYPLIINYGEAHSIIYIKAEASKTVDFAEVIDLGEQESTSNAASTKFNYALNLPSAGLWYIRFTARGLNISATTAEPLQVAVEVQEKIDEFPIAAGDLVLDFDANLGQTNSANKEVWSNKVRGDNPIDCILTNYNYASNGWDYIKEDGSEKPTGYLYSTGSAYGSIRYNPFSNFNMKTGLTLECVFKAEPNIGKDTPVFHYVLNTEISNIGIFIYQNRVEINLTGNKTLSAEFITTGLNEADNAIHVTFVINKQATDEHEPLIKIFVNGVLSAAQTLNSLNTISAFNNNIYLNRNTITGETGISKISALRLYERPLSDIEVLGNYMHNFRDLNRTQQEIADKNSLIKQGNSWIGVEADTVPRMDFYLTREQWETMTKDNKQKGVKITFKDKNLGEDLTWESCTVSWQGTSSIAYPVKNFKIKLDKKYTLKAKDINGNIIEKTQPDKTFCLKADYMDSSHYHNTGNANLIHDTGYLTYGSLTPPQVDEINSLTDPQGNNLYDISIKDGYKGLSGIKDAPTPESLKTRTTIYGYPIVLYIHLTEADGTESTQFEGIYNFNLDKGSNKSFGLYRENENNTARFQDCTSFEIAANKTYSAGGFRALKFVKNLKTEEYGWTTPSVKYNNEYKVDLKAGSLLYIASARADGSEAIKISNEIITYNEVVYSPITYVDEQGSFEGFYDNTKRYKVLSNGSYQEDINGTFIQLFDYDKASYELIVSNGELSTVSFIELNKTNAQYKYEVSMGSMQYSPAENWEIIDLPEILDYYYNYYAESFELRFPDADVYAHRTKGYNKLYYKEFDKIIALVDWVDSFQFDYEPGTMKPIVPIEFINDFSQHFDKETLLRYYIYVLSVGLIDNFGKNLMIDTWGYDINGEIPFVTTTIGETQYKQIYKYNGIWNEVAEAYDGEDTFTYGLIDENGNIYLSNENYSTVGKLIETVSPSELFAGSKVIDDRNVEWIYEIDYNRIIWYSHFYDLDSCLSSDNIGLKIYEPNIEMQDTEYINAQTGNVIKGTPFNMAESSLWSKLSIGFRNEIIVLQKESVDKNGVNNILQTSVFEKYYNKNIVQVMGERWYNQDAYPKYLSNKLIKVIINNKITTRRPDEYTHLASGNDWFRTKRWLTDRLYYLSTERTKEDNEDTAGGFMIRCEDLANYKVEFELYRPCYIKIISSNKGEASTKNYTEYIRVSNYNAKKVNFGFEVQSTDQEIYFIPGDNIKHFKIIKEGTFTGYRLKDFTVGSAIELLDINLANTDLDAAIGLNSAKKLRSIDISGCNLTASLGISEKDFPYLETIKLHNSTNASFTFNENGGILKEAYLNAASVNNLNIQSHYELTKVNIGLQYPDMLPNGTFEGVKTEDYYQALADKHLSKISNINIANCPRLGNIEITPYYKDENGEYRTTQTLLDDITTKFINKFGVLALFQSIREINLSNTFSNILNCDILLSLRSIQLVYITNCNIDKITFIAQKWGDKYSSYPGYGGPQSLSDKDYANAQNNKEGLHCDAGIKVIEFRPPADKNGKYELGSSTFAFPWRTYLGSLEGLEEILVNVNQVSQKSLSQEYTDNEIGIIKASKRFELILPNTQVNNYVPPLKRIVVNKGTTGFNFTSIRQPSEEAYDFNQDIQLSDSNRYLRSRYKDINLLNTFDYNGHKYYYFNGVDLSGYNNLQINFKGFSTIKGILGIDNIDIATMIANDPYILEGYFQRCNSLKSFYSGAGLVSGDKWTFTDSAWHKGAESFAYMFNGCAALTEDFISGYLNESPNVHTSLKDANNMFNGCNSLINIQLNWGDCPNLGAARADNKNASINSLFANCENLTSAELTIKQATQLKQLVSLFSGCKKLNNVKINHMDYRGMEPISLIPQIESLNSLFEKCAALESFDMTNQGDMPYQSGGQKEINIWQFDNLATAERMFGGCTSLKEIIFPENINFTNVKSLSKMFEGCTNLEDIFKNTFIHFYSNNDDLPLDMSYMFSSCSKLLNIHALANGYDSMKRVSSIIAMFANCNSLNTLSLENWDLNLNKTLSLADTFRGCSAIKSLSIPRIKVSSLANAFNGCFELPSLILDGKINTDDLIDISYCFANTEALKTLTGYEKWNVSKVNNAISVFEKCGMTQLNLTNWKLIQDGVSCSKMFKESSALEKIEGLNGIFGDYTDYTGANSNLGINSNAEMMFYGCSSLHLDDAETGSNLDGWRRAFTTVTNMTSFFEGCINMGKLSNIMGKNGIGYSKMPLQNFTKIFKDCSGFDQELVIRPLLGNYPAADTNVWILELPADNIILTLQSMVEDCSSLQSFSFNVGSDLSNLVETGLTNIFKSCSSLTSISFPNTDPSKKIFGIKNSFDLSDTKINIENLISSDDGIKNDIYWFTEADPALRDKQGVIFISEAQDEALNDDIDKKFEDRTGWTVGAVGNI